MTATKTQRRIQAKAIDQLPLVARQRLLVSGAVNPYEKYQTDPLAYAEKELGISPWPGRGAKGQRELYEDIAASVQKQLDGEPAPRVFRVESGNGLGKTFGVAPLVNWFFDAFAPSIVYTTAPSKEQVELLLWKYIKAQRPSRLLGRVLPKEPRMEKGPDHFALGKTTSDSGGKGEERFKGQHHPYLMFVLDEAEGIAGFVYDAIKRMMTGGLVILVILLGNPRSRSSDFFKWGKSPGVMNYRWSALNHPNVLDGAETVPGATNRGWVIERIWEWCDVVPQHDEDSFTFTLPFDVPTPPDGGGACGPASTVFLPTDEFLTSVMGIAPYNAASKTFLPAGRYEAACKREAEDIDPTAAWIGVDVAGFGADAGTVYVRRGGAVIRAARITKEDQVDYFHAVEKEALKLLGQGVTKLHIRVDAGGGFGGGVIALLQRCEELKRGFTDYKVIEVQFGGEAHDKKAYADLATEMYAQSAESCRTLSITRAPAELEGDLCEREYKWVNKAGVEVRKLEPKDVYRRRNKRSPDDGDGFVLCASPDFIFVRLSDKPAVLNRYGAVSSKRK